MKFRLIAFIAVVLLTNYGCKKIEHSADVETAPATSASNMRAPSTAPSLLEWQKCLGSTSGEVPREMKRTSDGGYIIAANSGGSNNGDVTTTGQGGYDAWIVKLSSAGIIEWTKTYGGAGYDWIIDVAETIDGYVFCGTTHSFPVVNSTVGNAWLVKIDKNDGRVLWEKVVGGSGRDNFSSISVTAANEILVAGSTKSTDHPDFDNSLKGGGDAWIAKYSNDNGTRVWSKVYGGTLNDDASYIVEYNGNFIIGGVTTSADGDLSGTVNKGGNDVWIFKVDPSGEVIPGSQKVFGGSGEESQTRILHNPNGGFVMSVITTSNDGDVSGNQGSQDGWVVKLDENFNITSKICLGGSSSDYLRLQDIDATSKDIFLVGSTSSKSISGYKGNSDVWVVRLSEGLAVKNSKALGGQWGETGWSAAPATGGYFVSARTASNNGDVSGNHGSDDVWLVKLKF